MNRVVYLKASEEVLAQRKADDASRIRRNFGLHQCLIEAMEDYYAALGRVRPNTVRWIDAQGEIPRQSAIRALSSEAPRHNRYDAACWTT